MENGKRTEPASSANSSESQLTDIGKELAKIEARVLPAPPKVLNGGRVSNWTCINFSPSVQQNVALIFCQHLANMCRTIGMEFAQEPVIPLVSARPDEVERTLVNHYQAVMSVLKSPVELNILIAILPDNNGPLYGELKRICETDLGIVSQCCLTKYVHKLNGKYLTNIALKINIKVGGANTVLKDALAGVPLVNDKPTIIFGADVTHPNTGEDSDPSIAAVVASQDWPQVSKYAVLVSAQAHCCELIQDLYKVWCDPEKGKVHGGMIREHLIFFKKATGHKPGRIIFYRDGVCKSKFNQVLVHELDEIRKACASLESDYCPPITFVAIQKNSKLAQKSGNTGTVFDTETCNLCEFDFYLSSRPGIPGTKHPVYYHVLWDENEFTAETLQTLTNNLCSNYAIRTRSVSIVPPAYYAHLAANRARFYIGTKTTTCDTAASAADEGTAVSTRAGETVVTPLPPLKGNLKNVMLYC